MSEFVGAVVVFVLFLVWRGRRRDSVLRRSGQIQTLAQGSEVRFHRSPRGFFGRRGGLR